jgi:hypothetical protein
MSDEPPPVLPTPPIPPGEPPLPVPPIPPEGGPPSNVTPVKKPSDGVEQTGSRLWGRRWRLSVQPPSGKDALDLSQLGFEFNIEDHQFIHPRRAHIKIWNVTKDTVRRMKNEFTHVVLEAGYQQPSDQYGPVFKGQIAYYKHGRSNATDTYLEIFGATWDQAINAAVVNSWKPKGYTTMDIVKELLSVLTPYGIVLGQITDLGDAKSPRGRLLFGMVHDILRDIARSVEGQVFLDQDGRLHILKDGEILKMGNETIPILNSKTGVVDVPVQTLGGGIEITCLLNPSINPGGRIHLNNDEVARVEATSRKKEGYGPGVLGTPDTAMKIEQSDLVMARGADGFYVVDSVRHQGENRGQSWHTHIVTEPVLPPVGFAG